MLCAVGLFCGSAYLLLGTNLGGRLGFLVAAAGLTGFLLLLTTLWWTSGSSGIDPPHGRSPQWNVVEVVDTPGRLEDRGGARHRDERRRGSPIDKLTNLKPAIDAAIVPAHVAERRDAARPRPFATLGFSSSTDYLVDFAGFRSYEDGGRTEELLLAPAAVRGGAVVHRGQGRPAVITPAEVRPAAADALRDPEHDLGTLRQPVVAYWFLSLVLFGLSLLGLHWYEKDQRARKRDRRSRRFRHRARKETTMVLAQQLIDASKDGGAAFIAFAIMVFLFTGSLFYMDQRPPPPRRARRATPATDDARATPRRADGVDRGVDVGVGVGQAREQRLVAARREVHAAVEQPVEQARVARRGRRARGSS